MDVKLDIDISILDVQLLMEAPIGLKNNGEQD